MLRQYVNRTIKRGSTSYREHKRKKTARTTKVLKKIQRQTLHKQKSINSQNSTHTLYFTIHRLSSLERGFTSFIFQTSKRTEVDRHTQAIQD